jgi:glutamate--cysteine ligase
LPGERATMSDWANHLSTIFPEVRLKTYLEMRGADAGPRAHLTALPALCAGLLYDAAALDQARELTKGWSAAARQALRDNVPALALDAKIEGRSLREIGRDVLALADAGLRRRARLDADGRDETVYLAPLEAILEDGRTLAQQRLDAYYGVWGRAIDAAFTDCVLPL